MERQHPKGIARRSRRSAAAAWAARWLDGLATLAFPPVCLVCQRPLGEGAAPLCPACSRQWAAAAAAPFCQRCGRSVASMDLRGGNPARCPRCDGQSLLHRGVLRVGVYEGELRACVRRFKYHADLGAGRLMADLLADKAAGWPAAAGFDAVVPVPMHWRRFLARGLNPAQWVARRICRRTHLPLRPWLKRVAHRPSQTRLPPAQRRANVRGAFAVPPWAAHRVKGRRLCLVDDVLTSGATAAEAARALLAAGAAAIHLAVLAVADHVEAEDV